MPRFAIDPVIRVRHPRYSVLRSVAEATELARDMAAANAKTDWPPMLRLLERVRSEDDALEAAVAIEGLLERDNLLVPETEPQATAPPPGAGPAACRGTCDVDGIRDRPGRA